MNDPEEQLQKDSYSWSQTDDQITISFLVPENCKTRDLDIVIEPMRVRAGVKGQPPVFNAKLYMPINHFDSLWQFEKTSATPASSLTVSPTLSIASSYAFMSSPNHSPNSSMILPAPVFPDPSMNTDTAAEVADLLQRTAALGSTQTSPSSSGHSSPVAITTPPSLATPPHLQAESSLQQHYTPKNRIVTIHLEKQTPEQWVLPVAIDGDENEIEIDPQSAYFLGTWLQSRMSNIENATKYYESAAGRGHVQAMMSLALLYDKTSEVSNDLTAKYPTDRRKAFEWYKRASDAGESKSDAHACFIVGGTYAKGSLDAGVERNDELALKYYNRAMEISALHIKFDFGILDGERILKSDLRSHPPIQLHERNFCNAAFQTGLLLWDGSDGKGTDARPELAVRYFKEAALLGSAGASHYVGVAYNNGIGVGKDEFEACKWFTRAHSLDHEIAMPRGSKQINWDLSLSEHELQRRRRKKRHTKKRLSKTHGKDGLLSSLALGTAVVAVTVGVVWYWYRNKKQ